MLRRLAQTQPESFAFTPENQKWAEAQMSKYPEGRQASAIIPLLWRAQEQEGWLSRPAIEHVCNLLGLAYIRGLEVATFYFMFQLHPTGSVAHVQVCGTTSCMICGAEDLIAVCREKIAAKPHMLSADGKFTWEEVECLGACSNAPMAQIGKDYYEDLTAEGFGGLLDRLAAGEVPRPGPQNGRYAAEPKGGLTSLLDHATPADPLNASVALARDIGDTIKRIDGSEIPLTTPWLGKGGAGKAATKTAPAKSAPAAKPAAAKPAAGKADAPAPVADQPAQKTEKAKYAKSLPAGDAAGTRPKGLDKARNNQPDDLKLIKGVGPALEALLHRLGFYHFDQIAGWTADEIVWVDSNLEGFKGRVTRDAWVEQSKLLATGSETEFSRRVKKGDVYE